MEVWCDTSTSQPAAPDQRSTLPISYFPFLTAEHDVSREAVSAFEQRMENSADISGECLVYIHIPFCETICAFCGFYRKSLSEFASSLPEVLTRFTDNLIREIGWWGTKSHVQGLHIGAVYVGGGSPSILSPEQIDRILTAVRSHLPVGPDVEFSFEGEARSLRDRTKLGILKKHGISRVSFGVQSFRPEIRKLARRPV